MTATAAERIHKIAASFFSGTNHPINDSAAIADAAELVGIVSRALDTDAAAAGVCFDWHLAGSDAQVSFMRDGSVRVC